MSLRFLRAGSALGAFAGLVALAGCSSSSSSSSGPTAPQGATVLFDPGADFSSTAHFFDFPWPSDLRLSSTGTPDVRGIANPSSSGVLEGLRTIAQQRAGYPVIPVAWFRFSDALGTRASTDTIDASAGSPVLLVDVDPKSATRGKLYPTIAETIAADLYVPANVLGVAVRPGVVLEPKHQYAFVVATTANDAKGKPLGVAPALSAAMAGGSSAVSKLYAVLPPALQKAGVDVAKVAAATVFTTGDVVSDLFALSSRVVQSTQASITGAAVDPDVKDGSARFCEIQAKITLPQFQSGYASPPFDTGGLFQLDASGAPMQQGTLDVPVTLTVPKAPMPAGGYPLVVYFHGTGGVSNAIADRGTWRPETDTSQCPIGQALDTWNGVTGCNTPGQGPGWVVAPFGIAMAAAALPLNPQRWPAGANMDLPEYIDINNVAATRDDFRQGVIEQRLLVDALSRLTLPPSAVSPCSGMSLPAGETAYRFNLDKLMAQGQSMGAMYANMVSAVEPRIQATVPTGSGGYWSWFLLQTQFIPGIKGKLGVLLDIRGSFSHLHPAMHIAEFALEPVDPIVFMPRLGHEPLPGHPVRPVYEPHGMGDSYFPTNVQDAVAMAYENRQAGTQVWPTMQQALATEGLEGLLPYPVSNDLTSTTGAAYTGVVVQYQGDGVYDPHAIYSQLDAVKYQYSCFFKSFLDTGKATVSPWVSFGTPCAE